MNKKLLVSLTSGVALLSFGVSPAFASTTTQDVSVKHNAYLISAPHVGSKHMALEKVGTTLTLESGSNRYWWHVQDKSGNNGYLTRNGYYTGLTNTRTSSTANLNTSLNILTTSNIPKVTSVSRPATQLPPGVSYDASVNPTAQLSSTNQQKFNAILQVAQSKLGTPYIWGHNEDRGQYGFDCSNFTAYVYHHALGYHMSGASQTQYHSVGWSIPTSSMQPGDLLVFDNGGHVGIFIGNGEMIQCGGGLQKVGYLKVSQGSYWYNHITVVKRMF